MNIWVSLALLIIGFIAIFIELFVPAAGAIGALGILCLIVSTILTYRYHGTKVGILFLAAVIVGTPFFLWGSFKIFPKTFMGKRVILSNVQKVEEGFTTFTGEMYEGLMGKEGLTITVLRPSGIIKIDGKKYSVVTSGELIEANEMVRVIKVEGSRVVVRKV